MPCPQFVLRFLLRFFLRFSFFAIFAVKPAILHLRFESAGIFCDCNCLERPRQSGALPTNVLVTIAGGLVLVYHIIDTQNRVTQSHALLLCAIAIGRAAAC